MAGRALSPLASDGRLVSVRQVRPVLIALALVDLLAPAVLVAESRISPALLTDPAIARFGTMLLMLAVVGSLVLVHNLYVGADPRARSMLRWPALALARSGCLNSTSTPLPISIRPGPRNWLRSMACSIWALRC
jgi:hypothetical protein